MGLVNGLFQRLNFRSILAQAAYLQLRTWMFLGRCLWVWWFLPHLWLTVALPICSFDLLPSWDFPVALFLCCFFFFFLSSVTHFHCSSPLLIVSDKPIIFINTWKCYFAAKPIHAIALIWCQMVIIRIRFQKVWISSGLPTLSLEAYKLIIIKNRMQMLEEKLWPILVSTLAEY